MASTFTLTSKKYDGRYLEVVLKQVKNIASNTSDIQWTLTVAGGDSNYYSTGPTTVKINGTQTCYYARKSYTTKEFPAARGSVSGKVTVKHNDDGSCTIPVSLTTAIYTSTTSTVSGNWVLDTIPRAASIGASDANIGSVSTVSVGITSKSFTHSVAYKFGNLAGYITANGSLSSAEVKLTSASIPFKLPESFYAQIQDAPYGTCTLTCKTYSGSTQIGQAQTCSFKAKADPDVCRPVVDGTVVDVNEKTVALTGNPNKLVRFMSKAQCAIDVRLQKSAGSVSQRKIGGVAVKEDTRIIENVFAEGDVLNVLFEATDSRGYSGAKTVPVEMIPYIQLTNNASVKRTDPTSGNAELTLKGDYFKGSFGAADNFLTASYSINGGDPIPVEVLPENASYKVNISLKKLNYQTTHRIEVTVGDALKTVSKTLTLGKGIPVFDWGENNFAFHVPVNFDQGVSGAHIRKVQVWGEKSFRLQSKYTSFGESGGNRQSIFLFGSMNGTPCMGVIVVNSAGGCVWSGTDGVALTAEDGGIICVTLKSECYDHFLLLSAESISIL